MTGTIFLHCTSQCYFQPMSKLTLSLRAKHSLTEPSMAVDSCLSTDIVALNPPSFDPACTTYNTSCSH